MFNRRSKRIRAEIALLKTGFDHVLYDDEDFSWVHVQQFALPAGWQQPATELLITLPAAYPHTPPNGFYLDKNLRLQRGRAFHHYFEEKSDYNRFSDKGWAWYCIHAERGNWSPAATVWHGDNLVKYVELIRTILTEIAQQ